MQSKQEVAVGPDHSSAAACLTLAASTGRGCEMGFGEAISLSRVLLLLCPGPSPWLACSRSRCLGPELPTAQGCQGGALGLSAIAPWGHLESQLQHVGSHQVVFGTVSLLRPGLGPRTVSAHIGHGHSPCISSRT